MLLNDDTIDEIAKQFIHMGDGVDAALFRILPDSGAARRCYNLEMSAWPYC